MTKEELQLAQYFYGIWRDASLLDLETPTGPIEKVLPHVYVLKRGAWTAFVALTGRLPTDTYMSDLNTENPAPWTKLSYDQRMDAT